MPKVLLHDHLDGGLRPATVVELAAEQGYRDLPTTDPDELAAWFVAAVPRRDLVRYLEGFVHTVGVMQTARGARARRGRVRRGPRRRRDRLRRGPLRPGAAHRARPESRPGGRVGACRIRLAPWRAPAAAGRPIVVRTLLTAMRTAARSREIAELAVRYRDVGVAGFDVAGPEAGYPPTAHLDAFHLVQRENFHATLHAGEAFGLPSIWQAIQWCNAERLGHGVRIVDDIVVDSGR